MKFFGTLIIMAITTAWSAGVVESAESFKAEIAVPDTLKVNYMYVQGVSSGRGPGLG